MVMNQESMDNFVFCIARKKNARQIWADEQYTDIRSMTREIGIPSSRLKVWKSEQFKFFGEFAQLHEELIPDLVVESVFSEKAFSSVGKYFRSMHFSDRFPFGNSKKVLGYILSLHQIFI